MTSVSAYFLPVFLVLFAQIAVEALRMYQGKVPFFPFVACALSLVFMDIFFISHVITSSISPNPPENWMAVLMLVLVLGLAQVGFIPAFLLLATQHQAAWRIQKKWTALFQALPALGLLSVFAAHSMRIVQLCRILLNP